MWKLQRFLWVFRRVIISFGLVLLEHGYDQAAAVRDLLLSEVRHVQLADSGCRQVQRHRRAQTAKADDQGAALFEAQLAVDVDLLQQNLSAIAQQLLIGQHGRRPKVMRS